MLQGIINSAVATMVSNLFIVGMFLNCCKGTKK
jgi:hypothetical protein